ncbi:hypothetical protein [Paenibacillus daejeonensis]|uniref:glycosyl-4,4'-diaponeurosporenoate acyltransferase CrtO family protein n=1 Tax=Paenibacillus daejeonensis TaxID=135193 RepID=UPI00038244DA|nr:hypothetical protein [Paenibacillus daejeonensis]
MFAEGEASLPWLLNGVSLTIIHMTAAWVAIRLPDRWFANESWLTAPRSLEYGGQLYERLLQIRRWKDRLPDGGAWFKGGFAKAVLTSREPEYMERFVRETRRGEWTHWGMLLALPLFGLWNSWGGMVIVAVWLVAANLPCILVQRYNRVRLLRVVGLRQQLCYTEDIAARQPWTEVAKDER